MPQTVVVLDARKNNHIDKFSVFIHFVKGDIRRFVGSKDKQIVLVHENEVIDVMTFKESLGFLRLHTQRHLQE
jgi:hypothetical protein